MVAPPRRSKRKKEQEQEKPRNCCLDAYLLCSTVDVGMQLVFGSYPLRACRMRTTRPMYLRQAGIEERDREIEMTHEGDLEMW